MNQRNKIIALSVCCAVLALCVIVLTVLLVVGNSDQTKVEVRPPQSSSTGSSESEFSAASKELLIYEVEEQGEIMLIKTSYGDLKYPSSLSDVVQVQAVSNERQKALVFSARLPSGVYDAYTISFSDPEGMAVGTLQLPEEKKPYHVTAILHAEPEGLSSDDVAGFHAVQETINDILTSFAENEGFRAIS